MEIKVLPNHVITARRDEKLMNALVRQGLPVQNVCNGKGVAPEQGMAIELDFVDSMYLERLEEDSEDGV